MKKKIFLILIFILAVYCLSGCANITYYNGMTEYGQMTRRLTIEIDEQYKDYAYDFAKQEVEKMLPENEHINVEYDDENCIITITEYYDNVTEYYLANGITGDEIYEETTPTKIKGFYKEYIETEKIIYSEYKDLVDVILEDYNIYMNGLSTYNTQELSLNYIYARPYKNIESNADSVILLNELYEHKWTTNLENMNNLVINITTKYPNSPMWYGSALVISIVLAVVAVFIKKYYEKIKDKNKNL